MPTHPINLPLLILPLYLVLLIPSLAVSVRGLHDSGRTGWWILLSFIPLLSLVLLIFYLWDSEPGTNAYGPNPKNIEPTTHD